MTGNIAFYFNWCPAAGQENFLLHDMMQLVQQGPHTTNVVWGAWKTVPRRRPRPRPGLGRAHKEMRNVILLQTTNYQLNQWDGEDRILRTDFNSDNQKIDAALKSQADALAAETAAREQAVAGIEQHLSLQELYRYTVDYSNQAGTLYITPQNVNWGQWRCIHMQFTPVLGSGITYNAMVNHDAKGVVGSSLTGKLHVQFFPMWDSSRNICCLSLGGGGFLYSFPNLQRHYHDLLPGAGLQYKQIS